MGGGRFRQVADTVRCLARSRPLQVFGVLWAAAVGALLAAGELQFLPPLMGVGLAVVCVVTFLLTEPHSSSVGERGRVWLQLVVILTFVALTAHRGLVSHEVVPAGSIPVWSPMIEALGRVGERWLGNANLVVNPVAYLVLPGTALLLMGARPSELGFDRGHRVGRVVALWCALPALVFVGAVALGQMGPGRLLERFASHFLQNGLMEEFLFRGALYTRLRLVVGVGWGLVIQALVFGAWHIGLGYTNTGHVGFLPALASVIVSQAVAGLAFGVVFERTRNLIAPTVVHVALNSIG